MIIFAMIFIAIIAFMIRDSYDTDELYLKINDALTKSISELTSKINN